MRAECEYHHGTNPECPMCWAHEEPKAGSHSLQRAGCAAGVESEVCPNCRNGFELDYSHPTEMRLKECEECGGTGRVERRQPQHNDKLSDGSGL